MIRSSDSLQMIYIANPVSIDQLGLGFEIDEELTYIAQSHEPVNRYEPHSMKFWHPVVYKRRV